MNKNIFVRQSTGPDPSAGPALLPARSSGLAFLQHLRTEHLIDDIAVARATSALTATSESIETLLVELGLLEQERLLQALASHLKMRTCDRSQFPAVVPEDFVLDVDYLFQHGILPLAMSDRSITVVTGRPLDCEAARAFAFKFARELVLELAPPQEIHQHLLEWKASTQAKTSLAAPDEHTGLLDSDTQRLKDLASEAPIIRLLDRILASASDRRASDIHFEPHGNTAQVRLRVDGMLAHFESFEQQVHVGLVSRIKILSRLNIAENRLPQDGRMRIPVRGRNMDFRVATSPMLHGEGVVLRLLDRRDIELDLASLGFPFDVRQQLEGLVQSPNGLFIVSGPTGSGKTTTLYAILSALNTPTVKIFTVEDPVEYHMQGINQIPVRSAIGLEFASILRSILRQDPDILMVGEIRDRETAQIAVQAALTGHLVLSTLHTNSAAASVTRLRDLGVDDFLLASTLRGVVAQRLVRKLCPACGAKKDAAKPSPGCPSCGHAGYAGRTVICEAMNVWAELRSLIAKGASESEIRDLAEAQGMRSLQDHGQHAVADGVTSQEEMIRVLGGCDG